MKQSIILAILITVLLLFVIEAGKIQRQREIEDRALRLKAKECYDWQDIEIIVFGEIQE